MCNPQVCVRRCLSDMRSDPMGWKEALKHFQKAGEVICPLGNGRVAYLVANDTIPAGCPYKQEHHSKALKKVCLA